MQELGAGVEDTIKDKVYPEMEPWIPRVVHMVKTVQDLSAQSSESVRARILLMVVSRDLGCKQASPLLNFDFLYLMMMKYKVHKNY